MNMMIQNNKSYADHNNSLRNFEGSWSVSCLQNLAIKNSVYNLKQLHEGILHNFLSNPYVILEKEEKMLSFVMNKSTWNSISLYEYISRIQKRNSLFKE